MINAFTRADKHVNLMYSENCENFTDSFHTSCNMKSVTQVSDTSTIRAPSQHKKYNVSVGAQGASTKTGIFMTCCVQGKHQNSLSISLVSVETLDFHEHCYLYVRTRKLTARKSRTRKRHFLSAPPDQKFAKAPRVPNA